MSQPIIGKPYDRVDGPIKVTGRALYTADNSLDRMAHAVVVASTIANGRITSIDESRARAADGVIEVLTHRNAPRVSTHKSSDTESILFVLQDDVVQFDRQPIAVVIAETFEQAVYGADQVVVTYEKIPPAMDMESASRVTPDQIFGKPAKHRRGNAEGAISAAPVRLHQTYTTPTEHHNPMETHGTIAAWDGGRLTIYDSTQWVFGVQSRIAKIFGIDAGLIHVVAPFVGGAFGGKGQVWSHVPLAVMSAKMVGRPVKLLATRQQMFGWVGHRPQTEQTVSLGAEIDGRLIAVIHDVRNETSMADEFVEPSAVFARDLYAVANFSMSQELRRLNISKPTYQRGPGESTGSFAIESAMDELSYALKMDPLALRIRNYSENSPDSGKPYTSKKLRECYELGSQRFGWAQRSPAIGSMRNGRLLVGLGMASGSRATHRSGASARIRMNHDGSVVIACGTIEQGTGSSTVYAQLASEILEIPLQRVRFDFGDTSLPHAPIAAGSQTASSVGSVVATAANQLREKLAALNGAVPSDGIELMVEEKPSEQEERFEQQAFGAHFAEVHVDPDLGTVRVARFVGAYDGGRILNEKTARSQFLGGVVWGISMALFEKTRYDVRSGRIMNANLSDYLIPTNADIPDVDIIIVEDDDTNVNPAHVRGIGEIGICGSAAAVANAVYHATGIRVRDLPISPDKLLI
ncbi:MAG TPA: xanthine dehydrogenase family protein molybdopterin-binding subunit [Candidatus Eremiobacteraceae bacterium]